MAHSLDLRSHLFYIDEDNEPVAFRDFELIVVAKGEPESNSGIFIHTDYELRDDKGHLANGYEVNLNTSPTVTRKTGSLYDVVDLKEQPLDDTQWFETRIRVEGKRIQVWLDGEMLVDYLEPDNPVRKPNRKGRLMKPLWGSDRHSSPRPREHLVLQGDSGQGIELKSNLARETRSQPTTYQQQSPFLFSYMR